MTYAVTSWFIAQAQTQHPPIKRVFTIGGSDYSRYVKRWPSVSVKWDDLRSISATISLENDEQTFNFFRTDKVNMRKATALKLGFTHPTSGDELINVHLGTVDKATYNGGDCTISMTDKFRLFAQRVVGKSDAPAVFSIASQLPSDIAWTLVTCYGGMDATQSSANTDLDWQTFQSWAATFSNDSVYVQARFEGQKVAECLRKISRYTRSAITQQNDKLAFYRFTLASTAVTALSNDQLLGLSVSVDDTDMTNRQWVYGDYRAESGYWAINVFDQSTASINSFAVRESVEKDESIWYVNSANALNLAQRVISTAGLPYDRVNIQVPLMPLHHVIGETIAIDEPQTGIAQSWRIMKHKLDMESGRMDLEVDASQLVGGFYLDVSTLDGPDLLL